MNHLHVLDVSSNQIDTIPDWIGHLASLRKLDVSDNQKLERLPRSILLLHLDELNARECFSLLEPPHFVCEAGILNMRQYYADFSKGSHYITLATVAVIGQKMAGKTSLVRSLKAKKIIKTYRMDNPLHDSDVGQAGSNKVDETTKVFNFVKVWFANSDITEGERCANVIDFGGNDIYHHAYQLTFKKDCIPIVVVNITQYDKELQLWGRREATRRVVFDWIAHLYLACPQLQRPLLALTHKDSAGHRFPTLKTELISTISELYRELLQERSLDEEIACLKNSKQTGFFSQDEIFEVCHNADYETVFARLEDVIHHRVAKSEVSVPISWKKIMDNIKSTQDSHLSKTGLLSGLDRSAIKQHEVVLDFMKRSGEILWYSETNPTQHTDLGDVVFHDVSKVTDMIKSLYNHSSPEHRCVLTSDNLEKIWLHTSTADGPWIPSHIGIKLLSKFNLIYGPTTVNHNHGCYLVPYFMKRHQFSSCKADINLQGDLAFWGLSIPAYAYQQMTVRFLKLMEQSNFNVHAFGNGASGRLATDITDDNGLQVMDAQFIHEAEHQKVITRIQGDVSHVHRCWNLFLAIIKELTDTVKTTWPAACIRYDFFCPHCLLLDELNPEKRSNPEFILKAIKGEQATEDYRNDCTCRKETEVPSPLRYPCKDVKFQSI